mmetsp:Transcript_32586/g.112715  ORF Transcript_32586/g.112715 Transcript_32586/m.112715 type:complete len:385 (-) Transcript_32586:669-1823(-)
MNLWGPGPPRRARIQRSGAPKGPWPRLGLEGLRGAELRGGGLRGALPPRLARGAAAHARCIDGLVERPCCGCDRGAVCADAQHRAVPDDVRPAGEAALDVPGVGERRLAVAAAQVVGQWPLVLGVLDVAREREVLLDHVNVQERVARLDAVRAPRELLLHEVRALRAVVKVAPREDCPEVLGPDAAEARRRRNRAALHGVVGDGLVGARPGEVDEPAALAHARKDAREADGRGGLVDVFDGHALAALEAGVAVVVRVRLGVRAQPRRLALDGGVVELEQLGVAPRVRGAAELRALPDHVRDLAAADRQREERGALLQQREHERARVAARAQADEPRVPRVRRPHAHGAAERRRPVARVVLVLTEVPRVHRYCGAHREAAGHVEN